MRRHTFKLLDNEETDIDHKLLEEKILAIKNQMEEAQKCGQKFLLAVESFVVIAILVLVTVAAINYQHNLLSPSIQQKDGS